jgi:hypothetical protein
MEKAQEEVKVARIQPRTTIIKAQGIHGADNMSKVVNGVEEGSANVNLEVEVHGEKKEETSHEVVQAIPGVDASSVLVTQDEDESKYYLTGKRLVLVYTGILL